MNKAQPKRQFFEHLVNLPSKPSHYLCSIFQKLHKWTFFWFSLQYAVASWYFNKAVQFFTKKTLETAVFAMLFITEKC